MKCPHCTEVLVTLEFDRIEIDYCPTCEGIWLDSGELDLLTAKEGKSDSLLGAFTPTSGKERKRKCPICSKVMKEVIAGGKSKNPVLLDECLDHGMWFDRGELKKILSAECSDTGGGIRESALVRLLDEIFVPCGEARS